LASADAGGGAIAASGSGRSPALACSVVSRAVRAFGHGTPAGTASLAPPTSSRHTSASARPASLPPSTHATAFSIPPGNESPPAGSCAGTSSASTPACTSSFHCARHACPRDLILRRSPPQPIRRLHQEHVVGPV